VSEADITGALRDDGGYYVRWVACGYSEIHGKDYWNTYTATTKAPGLRVFAAFVAAYDLDTCLIDDIKFFTQTAPDGRDPLRADGWL
jgi:hypothetical protein